MENRMTRKFLEYFFFLLLHFHQNVKLFLVTLTLQIFYNKFYIES